MKAVGGTQDAHAWRVRGEGRGKGAAEALERQAGGKRQESEVPRGAAERIMAQALREAHGKIARERQRHPRVAFENTLEISPRDLQHLAVTQRHHRGRAGLAGDERHLADGLAHAGFRHHHRLAARPFGEDDEPPRDHEIERLALLALAEENAPSRQAEPTHLLEKCGGHGGRQAAEKRRPGKAVVNACDPRSEERSASLFLPSACHFPAASSQGIQRPVLPERWCRAAKIRASLPPRPLLSRGRA